MSDETELEYRADALVKNAKWVRDNLDNDSFELARRIGLMKGDIEGILRQVHNDE